jgi:hypothetical protein
MLGEFTIDTTVDELLDTFCQVIGDFYDTHAGGFVDINCEELPE